MIKPVAFLFDFINIWNFNIQMKKVFKSKIFRKLITARQQSTEK